MNPIHSSTTLSKISAGDTIRTLAHRLQGKAITLMAGVAISMAPLTTPLAGAQPTSSTEENCKQFPKGDAKRKWWEDDKTQKTLISLKFASDVPPEYLHIYRNFVRYSMGNRSQSRAALVEAHPEGDDPYVTVVFEGALDSLPMLSIPKSMIGNDTGFNADDPFGRAPKKPSTAKSGPDSWDRLIALTPNKMGTLTPPEKRFPKQKLPLQRTLHSPDGKTIEALVQKVSGGNVTILRNGATAPMTFPINKLSPEDQTFLSTSVGSVRKVLMITSTRFYGREEPVENNPEFEITPVSVGNEIFPSTHTTVVKLPSLAKSDELKKLIAEHDGVWIRTPDEHIGEMLALLTELKKPAVIYSDRKPSSQAGFVKSFGKADPVGGFGDFEKEPKEQKPYVKVDGKVVFFRDEYDQSKDTPPYTHDFQKTEEAVAEFTKLMGRP